MSFITRPVSRVLSPVLGFLLGSSKPPKIPAQMLGELADQTAKEGEPRPIVFGIGRPIGGNVMYQSQPIRRMVKTYVGKSGGKGGSKKKKQYQDVEHVYRYYALRVCEGPITGFRRIWRNGTLVYDARKGSAWGAKNNHLFFNSYRLYTGGWDQMPDPAMQSMLKTTDIPAFRGTAYLMAVNEDLTDFGGAIPQWQFEVVRSEGYYLTSRPYALEGGESISLKSNADKVLNRKVYIDSSVGGESLPFSAGGSGLRFRSAVTTVSSAEEQVGFSAGAGSILLNDVVRGYEHKEPEQTSFSASASRVTHKQVVIIYADKEDESAAFSASTTGIKLHEN